MLCGFFSATHLFGNKLVSHFYFYYYYYNYILLFHLWWKNQTTTKPTTLASLKYLVGARSHCLSINHWRRKKWPWKKNVFTRWINNFTLSLSWHFLYHLAFTVLGNYSKPLCSWALRFQKTVPWPLLAAKAATFILLFLWITKQDIIVTTNRNCCSLLLILNHREMKALQFFLR